MLFGGDSSLLLAWLALGLLGGSGGGVNYRKLGRLNPRWGPSHPHLAGSRVSSRGPVNSTVTPYVSSLGAGTSAHSSVVDINKEQIKSWCWRNSRPKVKALPKHEDGSLPGLVLAF